jgi:hypothetical protein
MIKNLHRGRKMKPLSIRTRLILLLIFSGSSVLFGQPQILKLWPGKMPGPAAKVSGAEADMTKPDDKFIAGRKIIKLGNVSTPEMHVYLPAKEKGNGGAVLVCPGGGFSILAWDLEGTEVAEWLNSIGFAAIVVKYRVPTRDHGAGRPCELTQLHRALHRADEEQSARRAASFRTRRTRLWPASHGRSRHTMGAASRSMANEYRVPQSPGQISCHPRHSDEIDCYRRMKIE